MYGSIQCNACNSPILRAEVMATKRLTFSVSSLKESCERGLKGGWQKLVKTIFRSQVGKVSLTKGRSRSAPLRNQRTQRCSAKGKSK
ncbi:hypothetical protein GDO78_015419 [Eleutherodactylus coqui]|uniref:Uncharacterized protein n=1 Tax=Eleutherodactylus coqui TaxID=57060 RepID=A0A8J6B0U4_ELECQ|nr:hypothetical protein GDO78_015419 [Eleutherodactylus coqui]